MRCLRSTFGCFAACTRTGSLWELDPAARVYVAFVELLTCWTHRGSSVCSLFCIIRSSTRAGQRARHGYATLPMNSSQLFQTGRSTSYAHDCEAYVVFLVWAVVLLCALWAQVAWPGASRAPAETTNGLGRRRRLRRCETVCVVAHAMATGCTKVGPWRATC
jgi:hypothetical protein